MRHGTKILPSDLDRQTSEQLTKSTSTLKLERDHHETEDLGKGCCNATLENGEPLSLPHATTLSLAALTSALAG